MDSSSMMRHTVCNIAKELGHSALGAEDGNEGFDLASRYNPRLIILDLMAPEMDGVEMLTRLRADKELASFNVIVLTAVADKAIIRATQELGVRDFLLKPLEADEAKKGFRNISPREQDELAVGDAVGIGVWRRFTR